MLLSMGRNWSWTLFNKMIERGIRTHDLLLEDQRSNHCATATTSKIFLNLIAKLILKWQQLLVDWVFKIVIIANQMDQML